MRQSLILDRNFLEGREFSNKRGFPRQIKKEILILRKLGLEQCEIEYLVSLKLKKETRHKWVD